MNKEEIIKNLLRVQVDRQEVDRILNLKTDKGKPMPIDKLDISMYAILMAHFNLNNDTLVRYIMKKRNLSRETVRRRHYTKMGILKKLDINLDDIKEQRKDIKEAVEKTAKKQRKINNIVDKVRDFVSFFNISTDGLTNRISEIAQAKEVSQEDYIKELYLLRELFIGKARGEITTQQTETLWEVEYDKETGKYIRKQIYKNGKGKQVVSIRTQSYLPDEKSLVAIKVLDEMILQAQSSQNIQLTEEELTQRYIDFIEESNKQRLQILEAEIN